MVMHHQVNGKEFDLQHSFAHKTSWVFFLHTILFYLQCEFIYIYFWPYKKYDLKFLGDDKKIVLDLIIWLVSFLIPMLVVFKV